MDVQISRESGVTLQLQLGRQISLLIATGQLKAGQSLPSVRALATRLKISHNTVSKAYQDLADYHLIEGRRGSRMTVSLLTASPTRYDSAIDLDDVINSAIDAAQKHGYSLQQLRERVQERLLAQPPDHILVVSDEAGFRELLRVELAEHVKCPIATCSISDVAANRTLAIGALVVGSHGRMQECGSFLPKDRSTYPIRFNSAEQEIQRVRKLRVPSAIAVVSISEFFLQTARGVLAPSLGRQHTLREYLLPLEKPGALDGYSLVFCDSITRSRVKAKNLVHYRLISSESLDYLAKALRP